MECAVFSPCGRYWVRFRRHGDAMLLLITVKDASDAGPIVDKRPTLAAKLDARTVEEISTSAGVRKDFENFSNMIFNALIGKKSAAVRFFIENCDEMKRRIRVQSTAAGTPHHHSNDESVDTLHNASHSSGSIDDGEGSAFEREFFLQRKFFTLDYSVDFTRAIFPVPLEPYASESHSLGGSLSSAESLEGESELRKQVRKLTAENKKLARENEALTMLSNEKMAEMQRICEDLQRRAVSEAEHRRLKKELADAKKRVEVLERANDRLQREASSALRTASPRRAPTPSMEGPRTVPTRRGRFDTPPAPRETTVRGRGTAPRSSGGSNRSSPCNSRASTPPRSPRPAWGQAPTATKRVGGHYATSQESFGSASSGVRYPRKHSGDTFHRSSSPHDRLYMMDTAASSNLRRKQDPSRSLFN